MDINLAREMIKYQPETSLLQGLKNTWEWFKDNSDEYKDKQNYFASE